jgi:hypothetical protein
LYRIKQKRAHEHQVSPQKKMGCSVLQSTQLSPTNVLTLINTFPFLPPPPPRSPPPHHSLSLPSRFGLQEIRRRAPLENLSPSSTAPPRVRAAQPPPTVRAGPSSVFWSFFPCAFRAPLRDSFPPPHRRPGSLRRFLCLCVVGFPRGVFLTLEWPVSGSDTPWHSSGLSEIRDTPWLSSGLRHIADTGTSILFF